MFRGASRVTLDEKGRMRLPSGLISQLGERETYAFVINRGFEKCLMLYTEEVWDQITNEINALNLYVKKNRDFVRYFYRGANKVVMDSADRILLAKRLLEYAEIEKDAILLAYNNRIEIWSAEQYDQMLQEEPDDFSGLAEGVMELSGLSKPEAP